MHRNVPLCVFYPNQETFTKILRNMEP